MVDGDQNGRRSLNAITVNGQHCYSHLLVNGDTISFGHTAWASYQILAIGSSKFIDYLDYQHVQAQDETELKVSRVLNARPKMTFTDSHLGQEPSANVKQYISMDSSENHRDKSCQSFEELGLFLEA